MDASSGQVALMVAQGAFFVATGVVPFFSMRLFEAVTGKKKEDWLVKTVAALLTLVGVILLLAAWRREITLDAALMGAGSALVLAIVDIVYVSKGRIWRVYLLDAAAEMILLAGWVVYWPRTG